MTGYGTITIPATTVSSSEKWTIVGKQDSVVVKGKVYNNVVKVKRSTLVPGFDTTGSVQNLEIIYWVAKGIGMVKGVEYLRFMGDSLTVELVETNLTGS